MKDSSTWRVTIPVTISGKFLLGKGSNEKDMDKQKEETPPNHRSTGNSDNDWEAMLWKKTITCKTKEVKEYSMTISLEEKQKQE